MNLIVDANGQSLSNVAVPRSEPVTLMGQRRLGSGGKKISITPSQYTEFGVYMPSAGAIGKFSFKGREYLRAIYDTPAKRRLLCCGRQVEKCCYINDLVFMSDGSLKPAKDVDVGDELLSISDLTSVGFGKVSWKSTVLIRRCVRISTRRGFRTIVSNTHPMRRNDSWVEAGILEVGDTLAVVNRGGDPGWDVVCGIEDIGEQECVDFTVEPHHNFVADGFVTHNSTTIGNLMLSYSVVIPFFRTLYVSPSHQQTKVFSRDRLKEPIELSPVLKSYTNSKLLSNILEKKFMNGSQVTLRFAFLNADRVRGIPADQINIDEVQDVIFENIPVIEECASHSDYKLFTYSGTPKSLDGPLEVLWSKYSTQNEWVVPCRHHGTPNDPGSWHWNVLDEDNISPEGLVCDKCGKLIDAADADCQWAALNPSPRVENQFEGYRIPQLMVPWISWNDILHKQRTYSRAKFYNEVLGRSYDSGTRPLTRKDVMDNCDPRLSMKRAAEIKEKWANSVPVFLGTDWGTGESSYTVVSLGAYLPFAPDFFTFFYSHRFEGIESEPKYQIEQIVKLVRDFNVQVIGVDYGGGHWPNDELVRIFGAEKVKKYQWVGNVKKKITFEPRLGVPRFLCHRTEIMSDYFNAIKRRDVLRFPRWEEYEEPFAADHLNVYSEYSERLRLNVYKHGPGMPDDTVHANIYCFLASFFHKKRPDIVAPKREINQEVYDDLEDLDVELEVPK